MKLVVEFAPPVADNALGDPNLEIGVNGDRPQVEELVVDNAECKAVVYVVGAAGRVHFDVGGLKGDGGTIHLGVVFTDTALLVVGGEHHDAEPRITLSTQDGLALVIAQIHPDGIQNILMQAWREVSFQEIYGDVVDQLRVFPEGGKDIVRETRLQPSVSRFREVQIA